VNAPLLLGFCWFARVGASTPGPNTLLALATVAQFGAPSVRPHMLGVSVGKGGIWWFQVKMAKLCRSLPPPIC
jgi:threonine/homoserine/homoserine lactone efflux protein